MAKKPKSFADKVEKGKGKAKEGSEFLHNAKVITVAKSDKDTWKFNERIEAVTTKNQKEIMGS